MISSLILILIFGVIVLITAPLRLLDDVTLTSSITDAITTAGGFLGSLGQILPVSTILTVLAIVMITEGFLFLYKTVRWVYQKVPFIN